MGRTNRGKTTKLSIRLSEMARVKIDAAADNIGVSAAGVILLELSKMLKYPPSRNDILTLESSIPLKKDHFSMSVNEKIAEKINDLVEDYDIKKNILIGLMVSDYFERANIPGVKEPKKLMVQVNEVLKAKMDKFSEDNYVPLSGIVAYSILNGPYEQMPLYEGNKTVQFFTTVPSYIGDMVKDKADEMNIREHFYTSLCLYKQFMSPEGRFYEV
ncbi:hypothetical protein LIT32_26045 (plasmid) [Bacillus sp. CMF21]|nr:hypothetical protein LIT32_26045 [Bacillus sp. CMF21]